jgi:hypothetical protein
MPVIHSVAVQGALDEVTRPLVAVATRCDLPGRLRGGPDREDGRTVFHELQRAP